MNLFKFIKYILFKIELPSTFIESLLLLTKKGIGVILSPTTE